MTAIAATLALASLALPAGRGSAQVVRPSTIDHWGSFQGQHRPGGHRTSLVPLAMTVPGKVAQIGTSNSTDYALLANGELYAWGQGTHGQLGDGRLADSFSKPVRVRFPAGVTIASIPADVMPFDSALAIDTTGHVWGWGFNYGGELCLGSVKASDVPVRVRHLGDGTTGHRADVPVKVILPGRVRLASLGGSLGNNGQTLVKLANGALFGWGDDQYGQLGNGTTGTDPSPVQFIPPHGVTYQSLATSGATSYAITITGHVYAWGASAQGQAGDGSRALVLTPVKVDSGATAISATATDVAVQIR